MIHIDGHLYDIFANLDTTNPEQIDEIVVEKKDEVAIPERKEEDDESSSVYEGAEEGYVVSDEERRIIPGGLSVYRTVYPEYKAAFEAQMVLSRILYKEVKLEVKRVSGKLSDEDLGLLDDNDIE